MKPSDATVSTSNARVTSFLRSIITNRTALILIPVHLVAFAVLYWGMTRLIRAEVLATHSEGVRIMLAETIHSLHPLMSSPDHAAIPANLAAFAESHKMLDLRLFRLDSSLMGQPGQPQAEVEEFLKGSDDEDFRFENRGEITALVGIKKIRSVDSCVECHPRGELLGAATVDFDLTPEVAAAHDRLGRNAVFLVGVWVLVVGVVNFSIRTWTRRSLARLKSLEDGSTGFQAVTNGHMAGVLLDPVAAELYRSLTRVLQRQQEQQSAVSDQLHHTDRLASLGQLAAGLAHEIKNPLAGIRGVMELMRDDTDDEESTRLFETIVSELDRVNETIHALLHFAKPKPPEFKMVDVRCLLDDSLHLIRPSLAKKGIRLSVEVAGGVGFFSLDPQQIRQVLTNLVVNAADAIDTDGKIIVRASTFPEGEGLIISVEDDGPGIPDNDLERVFEPFFTTKFSGTGLGLAVIRSQIAQLHGRIEVDSEVGRGTTFFIILPQEDSNAPQSAHDDKAKRRAEPWP